MLKRDDNSFVDAATYERVNRLNRQLERDSRLAGVCDRWLYSACLCFGLSRQEQRVTGFGYRYSIFQLELSRNYLFAKPGVRTRSTSNFWIAHESGSMWSG